MIEYIINKKPTMFNAKMHSLTCGAENETSTKFTAPENILFLWMANISLVLAIFLQQFVRKLLTPFMFYGC